MEQVQNFVLEHPYSRVQCQPDETLDKGEHRHLCKECGTCWKHNGKLMQQVLSKEEFKLAHTCPKCGQSQGKKHRTEAEEQALELKLDSLTEKQSTRLMIETIFGSRDVECLLEEIIEREGS